MTSWAFEQKCRADHGVPGPVYTARQAYARESLPEPHIHLLDWLTSLIPTCLHYVLPRLSLSLYCLYMRGLFALHHRYSYRLA